MNIHKPPPATLVELIGFVESGNFDSTRRRDTVSAIKRIASMMGKSPQSVALDVAGLRDGLAEIHPAAHGISMKTLSNLKWCLTWALEQAGIVDRMPHGIAQHDLAWKELVAAISDNKRRAHGLAAFLNWCALNGIVPDQVSDQTVARFADWIMTRTLCAKPKDVIRRVPKI